MIAVKAVYEDGALRFGEPPPVIGRSPVIVIFLEAPSEDIAPVAVDRSVPMEVESEVILGRNVLNKLRLLLDGPQRDAEVPGP